MTAQALPLAVADLVVELGQTEILHGVSLEVGAGEIVGFVGPNGAGKTTTIRAVLGIYPPTSGTVSVFGAAAGSPQARSQIGFALDRDGLYDEMTAAENVAFFQRLYQVPDDASRVHEVLALVGLAERADDEVRTFSRGMRQRAAIARALVHRPGLLILDEPTSGIDPTGQGEIRALLQRIADSEGVAILMSSHNLEEVQRLARRIVVIAGGEIRASGDLAQLRHQMGSGTVTITTTAALESAEVAALDSNDRYGLRSQDGTVLTFAPLPEVTRVELVETVGRYCDVDRLVTDDVSLEALFAEVTEAAEAERNAAESATRGQRGRRRGRSVGVKP